MNEQKTLSLPLEVKFKVKDVLRYNVSVARKNITNCLVMLLGIGVLVYFFFRMATTGERLDIFLAKNIALLIVPLLVFLMLPWKVWKITAVQMQQPAFAYGVQYTFSKEGILLDIGEASDEMSWDLFVKIVESKHDFRFYINKVSAQIIPKHNMNEEQVGVLRQIIREAAPERCQLKG